MGRVHFGRRHYALAVCLLATLALIGVVRRANVNIFICKNSDTVRETDRICRQYMRGRVGGDLCRDLCVTSDLEVGGCVSLHVVKKLVFNAEWKGQKVVVKGDSDAEEGKTFSNFENYKKLVLGETKRILHLDLKWEDLKDVLWDVPVDEKLNDSQLVSALQVLRSREHFLFRLLPWLGPKIVGSCGHLYAERELQRLPYRSIVDLTTPTTGERLRSLRLGVKMLDWVERMRVGLKNSSLLYYDHKMEHFALDPSDDDGLVRLIDAGDVQTAVGAAKHKATLECRGHEDCRNGESIGRCDLSVKRCQSYVSNPNLRSVCHRVLLLLSRSQDVPMLRGLLDDRCYSSELKKVLEKCADRKRLYDKDANQKDAELSQELRIMILREIDVLQSY